MVPICSGQIDALLLCDAPESSVRKGNPKELRDSRARCGASGWHQQNPSSASGFSKVEKVPWSKAVVRAKLRGELGSQLEMLVYRSREHVQGVLL